MLTGSIQRDAAEKAGGWPGVSGGRIHQVGQNSCCRGSFWLWPRLRGWKQNEVFGTYVIHYNLKMLSHFALCTQCSEASPADIWISQLFNMLKLVKAKVLDLVSRWPRISRLAMHEQWGSTSATWDWGKFKLEWESEMHVAPLMVYWWSTSGLLVVY